MGELFDLAGRVVIVTGGTRGIGFAMAEGFVAAGAKVVIGSRDVAAVQSATAALSQQGGEVAGIAVNMGDLAAGQSLAEAAVANFGRIDVVVNNAATGVSQPLGEITPEAFEKVFAVDVRGPLFLVQAALPLLRAAPRAAVINVISPAAYMFSADNALYAGAKAALLSLTRSMAEAFAADGIRVNALSPGPTDTRMMSTQPDEVRRETVEGLLLRRIADPREMVGPALFLASQASSFMTGQVLTIDGGLMPC
ncbi:SDR family NAD(P)-dependent oxidoreductase [Mycolicibacterium chitae]|uniref:SDR family NAD(P)-dependent oxidoreductase n=1 Tax=Mycolicibacterium chitae TaxID=1792 RepID=UPI0027E25898|nr:SDR family oxidoreductase [Mycolicibacterium chitae]